MTAVDGRVVVVGICLQNDAIFPFWGMSKELDIRFSIYYGREDFTDTLDALDRRTISTPFPWSPRPSASSNYPSDSPGSSEILTPARSSSVRRVPMPVTKRRRVVVVGVALIVLFSARDGPAVRLVPDRRSGTGRRRRRPRWGSRTTACPRGARPGAVGLRARWRSSRSVAGRPCPARRIPGRAGHLLPRRSPRHQGRGRVRGPPGPATGTGTSSSWSPNGARPPGPGCCSSGARPRTSTWCRSATRCRTSLYDVVYEWGALAKALVLQRSC